MDKLATLENKSLILDLKRWWNAATHPPSLAEAAYNISKEYSLSEFNAVPDECSGSKGLDSAASLSPFYNAKDELEDSNPKVALEHAVTTFGMLASFCPFIANISQRMQYILRRSIYPFRSERLGYPHALDHYDHFSGSQISLRPEYTFSLLG